jgi:hypothetical protein
MNFDILTVLRWPELTSGWTFPVWQMQLPLPQNWEMIRCAWGDECRIWSGPQTSNGSAFMLSNECNRWILIFWPSSDDQNLPQGNPFQFNKWSYPFPKIGKWSDVLEATSVGHDPDPRRPMEVHLCCQMNTIDEFWYFDCPQTTRTYLRATLSSLTNASPPSPKLGNDQMFLRRRL